MRTLRAGRIRSDSLEKITVRNDAGEFTTVEIECRGRKFTVALAKRKDQVLGSAG